MPSFFVLDAEVRPFGPTHGAAVVAEQGRAVAPVGILGGGMRVFVVFGVDDESGCDTPPEKRRSTSVAKRTAYELARRHRRAASRSATTGLV